VFDDDESVAQIDKASSVKDDSVKAKDKDIGYDLGKGT